MKTFTIPHLLAFAAASCLLTACQMQFPGPRRFDPKIPPASLSTVPIEKTALTDHVDASLLQPPAQPFTLGPGDRIEVEVFNDLGSRQILTVGPDGKIYFGMLDGLDVWGKTLAETQELLQKQLGKFNRGKIEVTIVLRDVESKKVWMLGRVAAPGVYSMSNSLTLLEAIFNAGGPLNILGATGAGGTRDVATIGMNEDLVNFKRSFVLRQGKMLPIDFERLFRGDMAQNAYLQPDDYVFLAPGYSQEIHVIGAVGSPGTIPFTQGMNLIGAIASAGGTIPDAYTRQVAIVRGSLHAPEIALVDLKMIEKGLAPNVYLAADDIVYIPVTPYHKLKQYWDILTDTFVGAVAINEGARATLSKSAPATGILIPFGSTITVVPPTPR
jgi:polysaccharide biosynthesis/export protein